MSTYRKRSRDEAIADRINDASAVDRSLMCRAAGCPLRWSVNAEGRVHLCSAHAWQDPQKWPGITQLLQERVDAHMRGETPKAPAVPPATRNEALAKLRKFVSRSPQQAVEAPAPEPAFEDDGRPW